MGYFNFYFLRKLFLSKRFRKILFYIGVFIFFIFIWNNVVFGFNQSDLSNSDFSQTDLNRIYDFIQQNKGDYDSVICCYHWNNQNDFPNLPETALRFWFYNFEDIGYLYTTLATGDNHPNNYTARGHYTSDTNNVHYIALDYTNFNNVYNDSYRNNVVANIRSSGTGTSDMNENLFCTNRSIYTSDSFTNIWFQASDVSITNYAPYIINYNSVPSWNFNTLNIGGYYLVPDTTSAIYSYTLYSYINNGEYSSSLNVKPYSVNVQNNQHIQLNIPRQQLLTNYNIEPNDTIHFVLKTVLSYNGQYITDNWDLGTYTLGVTQSEADSINSNSNKQQLTDINNSIQNQTTVIEQQTQVIEQQTEAIEDNTDATKHLEDTITDDTVETTADDLPSIDVGDPSQSGIDNIFQSIYNAFCTGQAQDIVFPIPFTNKNITLNPYYVRDMLNNNGAGWVYTLIQAFWGYLIGRYIVKDISKKITKVKSGNIENIENENIKEEML